MNTIMESSLYFIHSQMLVIGGVLLLLGFMAVAFSIALLATQRKLKKSYSNVLYSLVLSLETRDLYSAGHSKRVAELSKQLAEKFGLNKDMIEVIKRAGLLHDIGKIGIPDNVLLKNTRLDLQETIKIREHPMIASSLLRTVQTFYAKEIEIIVAHHERWDGQGYPLGLRQNDIPLGAQIMAIADTFDAMTSDRPYRKALSINDALNEIVRNAGTQFNLILVQQFIDLFEKDYILLKSVEDILDYQI